MTPSFRLPRPAKTCLAAALLAAALSTSARAAPVVGTDPGADNGGFGIGFSFADDVNLVIAQQFSLQAATTAGGISVWLNGLGEGQFTLQVMSAIGAGASAADVLLALEGNLPDVSDGHLEVAFTGLSLNLAAATDYYLVISSDAGPGTGWGTTTEILDGLPGTVGNTFVGSAGGGAVADYTALDTDHPNPSMTLFRIDDAPATPGGTVPEPSSLALAAVALLAAAMRRKPMA